jgi:hypothetical protein
MIKNILLIPLAIFAGILFTNKALSQTVEPEELSPYCKKYVAYPDWRGYATKIRIGLELPPIDEVTCVVGGVDEPIVQAVFDDNFIGNIGAGQRQGIYTGFFEDGSVRVAHYTKNRDGIIDSLEPIVYPEMYLRIGNLRFDFDLDPKTQSYRLSKKAVAALIDAHRLTERVTMFFSPKGLVNKIGPETLLVVAQMFSEGSPYYQPTAQIIKSKGDPLYVPPAYGDPLRNRTYKSKTDEIQRKEQIDYILQYGF